MISGLWSNSNWDDDKNSRQKALQEIDDSYRSSIREIYEEHREKEGKRGDQIDYSDPFFAPIAHLDP